MASQVLEGDLKIIKVRPNSEVTGIASLIANSIEEDKRVVLRAIGAGAVNQTMKGIIKARQQLAARGFDLVLRPGMQTVKSEDGGDVSAMVFHCLLL